MTNLPKSVGVSGGARMGAGIAHAFLIRGSDVTVVESSPETTEKVAAGQLGRKSEQGCYTW